MTQRRGLRRGSWSHGDLPDRAPCRALGRSGGPCFPSLLNGHCVWCKQPVRPDVSAEMVGTNFTAIRPLNESAKAWLRHQAPDGSAWFGQALVVDNRQVDDLLSMFESDGFKVRR